MTLPSGAILVPVIMAKRICRLDGTFAKYAHGRIRHVFILEE